jgi:hypothetical protein
VKLRKGNKGKEEVEEVWDKGKGINRIEEVEKVWDKGRE